MTFYRQSDEKGGYDPAGEVPLATTGFPIIKRLCAIHRGGLPLYKGAGVEGGGGGNKGHNGACCIKLLYFQKT